MAGFNSLKKSQNQGIDLCFFQKYYLNFLLYFPNTFQGMSKQSLPPRLQVNLQTTRYQEL